MRMRAVLVPTVTDNKIRTNLARLHGRLRNVSHHVLLPVRELTIRVETLTPSVIVTNRSFLELRKWPQFLLGVGKRAILAQGT